jgi:quercetin dioxygenase-like cupin family protein
MSVNPYGNIPLSDLDERIYQPLSKYQKTHEDAVKAETIYNGPILAAIVFTMLPGQVHRAHKHEDQTQMWIIVSGKGEVIMDDGRTEIVGPGAICVHHKNQLHGINTVGEENLVYITVSEKSERKPA